MKSFNKFINYILLIAFFLGITGCAMFGTGKNKNTSRELNAKAKVENVEALMVVNLKDKLAQVASLNYGVGYALGKEADPTKNVQVALDLNTRAMSLTGTPTFDEIKKMQKLIDDLTSQLKAEQERGAKELSERDTKISGLQLQTKQLTDERDAKIKEYMKVAADTAAKADAVQTELDNMNSFMGLGAIWYGAKRLVTRLAWFFGAGTIVFLILRFASMSNPIAASIFNIFNLIGSWVINVIKLIVPKAVDMAGHVGGDVFNVYKSTLTKVVDAIQLAKSNAQAAGKQPNIEDVLNEVAKTMDTDEKAVVEDLKKNLNWK